MQNTTAKLLFLVIFSDFFATCRYLANAKAAPNSMPGSAENCHYFPKAQHWHFGIALLNLRHHRIPRRRCREIVIVARCGIGHERVDKYLGITGIAHSGPATPQYGKRVMERFT